MRMKSEDGIIRARMLRGGIMLLVGMLLVGMLLWVFSGSSHNPNHDINVEQARAAANRVHSPPKLSPSERAKAEQDHGG